ncbi:MAG: GDSL-type esterase/lipase family protein [Lentisphaerota bacterium]
MQNKLNLSGEYVESTYYGHLRYDFVFHGYDAIVVLSNHAAAGNVWAWRARFWNHQGQLDRNLLNNGFHLVLIKTDVLYGCPAEVEIWNSFYQFLTGEIGFSAKTVLIGMSRGGLIIYNWAKHNPEKVAAIYGDAPVCDFQSWPGGRGAGAGSPDDYKMCLDAYNLTEAEAEFYADQPKDNLEALAEAGVPVLHVLGDDDIIVPLEENSNVLVDNYRKAGGRARVISKRGCEHHPHCLKDPAIIVEFFKAYALGENCFIKVRDGLKNSGQIFRRGRGRVAFIGGSITAMNGYTRLTENILKKEFPQCAFDFINNGESSTCSDSGAFRIGSQVLSRGKVDLLFVEFAVNDNQDGNFDCDRSVRAMEGIVRQARTHNPDIDIVFLYTVNEAYLDCFNSGVRQPKAGDYRFTASYDNASFKVNTPLQSSAHELVAEHYKIPAISFAGDVAQRMAHGEFDWKTFGGCHPAPFGAEIFGENIDCFLRIQYQKTISNISPYPLPPPFDKFCFEYARIVNAGEAKTDENWKIGIPDWSKIEGVKRQRYTNIETLYCDTPEASLTLDFEGGAVGFFLTAGPDAGMIEYKIDNEEWSTLDLFNDKYGIELHYPCTILLESELSFENHRLELKISTRKNLKSSGHAVRIINFSIA